MMKRLISTLILLNAVFIIRAAITVTAQGPGTVSVDDQFRIQYTVNSTSVSSISNINSISGFDVVYGPAVSTMQSVQSINGHTTSNSSTTYSYTLIAKKTGTYTMPKLSVKVNGQTYTSNSVQVKVVAGGGGSRSNSSAASSQSYQMQPSSSGEKISNKDLFIAVTANKREVYENEPVLLSYRVYTRVELVSLSGKMPDLEGYLVKEIPLPQQKDLVPGSYNGQNFMTTLWSQYLMFPQKTGKLTIPDIKFDGVVMVPNRNIRAEDIMDALFNGIPSSVRKNKTIIAPSFSINVKPLPEKPSDFSGGVGTFSIKASVKNKTIREYETLDLQVVISGTGNVDLIKAPKVAFPADFDTYDPKMKNNTQLSATNMNGNLVIDYLAVPKNKGKYTIPSIEFVYFDTQTNSYKTISTEPITIDVLKGDPNAYAEKQREIQAKSDIRFIKMGDVTLRQREDIFWNTMSYWMIYLVLLLAAGVVFYVINHRMSMQGDSILMRRKGAGRLAARRLKRASKLQQKGDSNAFYEEMLNALNGFVADKLNIPVSELSKERIKEEFSQNNISPEVSASFLNLLDECEFMRYAGSMNSTTKMSDIYQQGIEMIGMLDSVIKKKK